MTLKDTITSKVTGDAYDKPAKTADGAFTTQDSDNAHTIEGTSADPNSTGSAAGDKMEEAESKAKESGDGKSSKLEDMANNAAGKMDQAQNKAQEVQQKAK